MKLPDYLLPAICIALAIIAGCTNISSSPAAPAAPAVSQSVAADSGCSNDVCSAVPPRPPAKPEGLLRIEASPYRYSPVMSSTPGIGLTVNTTGINNTAAEYSWNASYGRFLAWNAPDYTVHLLGNEVTNNGEKLYWTFTDKPASVKEPVLITVTAKDPHSGSIIGSATLSLAWDGDNAVIISDNR